MNEALVDVESIPASSLNEFIRECRLRIDPQVRRLGSFLRPAARVGRPVSQEEASEAIGVSRQWYSMMEVRVGTRVSTAVLARFVDAFMLTPLERETLFKLAFPEIVDHRRQPDPAESQPAFSWTRSFTRRLWRSTNPREALTVATEQLAAYFHNAPLAFAVLRVGPGIWEHVSYVADHKIERQNRALWSSIAAKSNTDEVDEIGLYPILSRPGEVGTMASFASTEVRRRLETMLAERGLSGWNMLHGRVRSKDDTIASLIVMRHAQREYSETDIAVMSACAHVTSLALS